ncbi:MAG: helix-turn-helix domain-containing protein [Neisseria sp.]|nr:helix-turn-helix domain-containing protein [Neisseria sp.]
MVNESRNIQSVERAMYLLERIAAAGGKARLAELAAESGLHKATLHGLLNTLCALGYVGREGRAYVLGLRFRELAQSLDNADEALRHRFRPLAERLHAHCGEAVYLAVPCGTREYLYIDVVGGGYFQGVSPRGRREGLTTSATGKVFLAFLPEMLRSLRRAEKLPAGLNAELKAVAERGYALDLAESEAGLHAFALPLFSGGRIVAGIAVAGAAERLPQARLHEWAVLAKAWAAAY